MLEGQVCKSTCVYSDRVHFRVPKYMYAYVKTNVRLSNISLNRWLSDAIVAFGNRIVSTESPVSLTNNQINEGIYQLIEGTRLSYFMQFEESIKLHFTDAAEYMANNIVGRYSTQLAEGESLPKNIKSKLMLIVLLDHMLRHNYSEKFGQAIQ